MKPVSLVAGPSIRNPADPSEATSTVVVLVRP
jgi:hypothetical protein